MITSHIARDFCVDGSSTAHKRVIRELAERIIDLAGSRSKLIHESLPADDPTQRCPDISLTMAELDWEPGIPLRNGLKKTIPYFEGLLLFALYGMITPANLRGCQTSHFLFLILPKSVDECL